MNVAFLHGLVAATQRALGHDRVGIYASQSQWTPIMCGDKSFSDVPLWYAHRDQQAGTFTILQLLVIRGLFLIDCL